MRAAKSAAKSTHSSKRKGPDPIAFPQEQADRADITKKMIQQFCLFQTVGIMERNHFDSFLEVQINLPFLEVQDNVSTDSASSTDAGVEKSEIFILADWWNSTYDINSFYTLDAMKTFTALNWKGINEEKDDDFVKIRDAAR